MLWSEDLALMKYKSIVENSPVKSSPTPISMEEKEYILTYEELVPLVDAYLQYIMNDRDGIDNWAWFGTSLYEVIADFHPDGITPKEAKKRSLDTEDTARAMIEAGMFRELITDFFDESGAFQGGNE